MSTTENPTPSEAELKAAELIDLALCEGYRPEKEWIVRAITQHTRHEGKTAQEWFEKWNMETAAIMTASIQNTESTVKDRIGRDNPYWSQAYADVCAAVDREMRERKRAEAAERRVQELLRCGSEAERCGKCIACLQEDAQERDIFKKQLDASKKQVQELESKLAEYRKAGLADYHQENLQLKERVQELEQENNTLKETMLAERRQRDAAVLRWCASSRHDERQWFLNQAAAVERGEVSIP